MMRAGLKELEGDKLNERIAVIARGRVIAVIGKAKNFKPRINANDANQSEIARIAKIAGIAKIERLWLIANCSMRHDHLNDDNLRQG